MTGYTVDAGVLVKSLVDEAHSGEAAALPDSGLTLVAPALILQRLPPCRGGRPAGEAIMTPLHLEDPGPSLPRRPGPATVGIPNIVARAPSRSGPR